MLRSRSSACFQRPFCEVTDAERELVEVKTSVEDAEAVYNNVRTRAAESYLAGGLLRTSTQPNLN